MKYGLNPKYDMVASFYTTGVSIGEVARRFDISWSTVKDVLVSRGILRPWKPYKIDSLAFSEIETEEAAYFLGFLYGDGCVSAKPRKKKLHVGVKTVDIAILARFQKFLGAETPIRFRKKQDFCYLEICNSRIVDDLIACGCVENKSLKIRFPMMRNDLIRHFIRGVFDADGHFNVSAVKAKSSVSNREWTYQSQHIGITCSYEFVCDLEKILRKYGIQSRVYLKSSPSGKVGRLVIAKKAEVHRMYEYMYSDSTVWLLRKRDAMELWRAVYRPIES